MFNFLNNSMYRKITDILSKIHSDSLFRNSMYLILSQLALAALGFFFWIINARLFPPEQIGIATTLITISVIITSLSQLGFNTATVSYLFQEKDRNSFVNTSFSFVSIGSIIFTSILFLIIPVFARPLIFVRSSFPFALFFTIIMIVSSINAITDSIFIAFRSTKYILLIDIIVGLVKLSMPFLMLRFAAAGIFYAYSAAVLTGMILSVILINRVFKIPFKPRFSQQVIRKVWRFSASSYLSNLVNMISSSVTPLLIVGHLGPKSAAFYYMPSMVISFMVNIPRSVSSSMFAEGTTGEVKLFTLLKKSLVASYALLIPMILGIILLGKYFLLLFGKQYSDEGYMYLVLSSSALLITAPNYVLGTLLNIHKDSRNIIIIGLLSAVVNVLFVFVFLRLGLAGVGVSSILSQIFLLCLYSVAIGLRVKKGEISLQ